MERLIELLDDQVRFDQAGRPHAYLIRVGAEAEREGLRLAEQLRDALPGLQLTVNCGGGNFKSQFKRADKSGAELALILGEDEARDQLIGIKPLRKEANQFTIEQSELAAYLETLIF
jgi:histidyl-tRNA synthetase